MDLSAALMPQRVLLSGEYLVPAINMVKKVGSFETKTDPKNWQHADFMSFS
jgi:hypothetical protein